MKKELSQILNEYLGKVQKHNEELGEELDSTNFASSSFEGFALWLDTGKLRPQNEVAENEGEAVE